jgi:Na+/proline symporter
MSVRIIILILYALTIVFFGIRGMKLFASIIIFVFLIPYSGAVFIGLSHLFKYSFQGIEYWHAVVFMGVFTSMAASTVFALLVGGIAYFVGSTTRFYINPETAPAVFEGGSLNVDALMPGL